MGVVNIVSSAFGCFPAFGSLGRSSVNDAAGAKSQMAGFFTCMFVVITCVWLLPVFEYLPKAVCSSIIVVAVLKLIELDDVYFMLQVHAWKDLALLMLTFLSTILISIETGTLISVGVSLLLVVKHTTKTRIALLGYTTLFNPSTGQTKTKFKTIHGDSVERIRGCILVRLEESLFFGNVGQLKDRLKRIEMHGDLGVHPSEEPRISQPNSAHSSPTRESGSELKSVIFEMSGVASVDARYFNLTLARFIPCLKLSKATIKGG